MAQDSLRATVTIAEGASLSGAVDMRGYALTRVILPAEWTAADLTFQESLDNSTFYNLSPADSDTEYTVEAAASACKIIPPSDLLGAAGYLKVRSGTSGTPVNQAAARTVTLCFRAV